MLARLENRLDMIAQVRQAGRMAAPVSCLPTRAAAPSFPGVRFRSRDRRLGILPVRVHCQALPLR